MNAEFEAFLNNEVGKMYANDTQKLMLYRVDAAERGELRLQGHGPDRAAGRAAEHAVQGDHGHGGRLEGERRMKQEMLLCVPCAERMKQEGKRVEHTGNVRGKLTCGCCERRRYGGVYVVEL